VKMKMVCNHTSLQHSRHWYSARVAPGFEQSNNLQQPCAAVEPPPPKKHTGLCHNFGGARQPLTDALSPTAP
jgi:hypothetical protein